MISFLFFLTAPCGPFTDCLYIHDEYYGASTELGLNNRTDCAGVQLEQIKTVLSSISVLQDDFKVTLRARQKQKKNIAKINERLHL